METAQVQQAPSGPPKAPPADDKAAQFVSVVLRDTELVWGKVMAWNLTGTMWNELERESIIEAAGPEMLADAMRLGTDDDVRAAAAHHADTVPCELGPAVPITPFVEPIDGVAVREVSDADLFRHFFGR